MPKSKILFKILNVFWKVFKSQRRFVKQSFTAQKVNNVEFVVFLYLATEKCFLKSSMSGFIASFMLLSGSWFGVLKRTIATSAATVQYMYD